MPNSTVDYATIYKITQADSVLEAWEILKEVGRDAGFDCVIYGTNRLRKPGVFGDHSDSLILSNAPQQLMKNLWGERNYLKIPVVLWAIKNSGAMSLKYGSDLYHGGKLPPEQQAAQKHMMDLGVTSGYVLGLHSPRAVTASMLSFFNFGMEQEDCDTLWEKSSAKITSLAAVFHLRVLGLPLPLEKKQLTKRQKEVLRWIGQGKTMNETAIILNLAPATVEKHLRQARETLGVSTTTQAVLHAQIVQQIFSVKE